MKRTWMVWGGVVVAGGCAHSENRRVVHPGAAVVGQAELAQAGRCAWRDWQPGVDRLYRLGGEWVAREEVPPRPIWMTMPTRKLVVGDEAQGAVSLQPAPLEAALRQELVRLKALVASNQEAMEAMRAATARLAEAAQELARQSQATGTVPPHGARGAAGEASGARDERP